jgi:hypothetical protein
MPRVRPSVAIFFCLCAAGAVRAAPSSASAGWQDLGRLDNPAALQDFSADLRRHPDDRTLQLGKALAQLNAPSRSDAHLAEARTILTRLRHEKPDDDTGIAAAYYLARIHQLYEQPADRGAAIQGFRALLAAHPGQPIAELAAPKLAVLLLYADVPLPVWNERVAEIEALIPRLQSRPAQRDTRLVLADALVRLYSDHARAYPLLQYCLAHDLIVRPPAIAATLLEAAESARQLGLTADAAAYCRRYVEEFPYESSTDEIKRRLAQLETKGKS